MLIQFFLGLLVLLIALGALVSPELGTFALQLIALITLFSFVVRRLQKKEQQIENQETKKDEDTLLFLTTEMKPGLERMRDQEADAPTPETLLGKVNEYISKR